MVLVASVTKPSSSSSDAGARGASCIDPDKSSSNSYSREVSVISETFGLNVEAVALDPSPTELGVRQNLDS
jgi:hypothetical protein